MKIDRHNYEEYFILYWDNELSGDQKRELEKFVNENDDLQEEFRLLGETRFNPDNDIQYEYKKFLLNRGDASLNISNYKEQLLSHIDDELTPDQKLQLEEFVAIHPAAQKELAQLKKVKLEPEGEIVFPDKAVLYRRDEKIPVIRLTWLRVAAAAAVIVVAGLITFQLTTNNPKNTTEGFPVAKSDESKSKEEGNTSPQNSITDNNKTTDLSTDRNVSKESEPGAATARLAISHKMNKGKVKEAEGKSTVDQPLIAQTEVPQNTTDEITYLVPAKSTSEVAAINETEKKMNLFENTGVTERPSPSYTIYNESPKESGGLKEFLRKTTRMIERRTRMQTTTDDNKLLVGAFAVSL